MGFNAVRKHQKIENPRFLYWADVMGLMVWEEMPAAYAFNSTAVDRFITLWEMAGDVIADPIIREATDALKAGGGPVDPLDVDAITASNRELLSLHELIAHRMVQILLGQHRGRKA